MKSYRAVLLYCRWFALPFAVWLALWLFTPTQAQSDPPIDADGWDLSFGGDGGAEVHCPVYAGGRNLYGFLPPRPNSKILVQGDCWSEPDKAYKRVLLRFLPNGLPDPTFGNNGQASQAEPALAWATQTDGKIVMAIADYSSEVVSEHRLTRYQDNGLPDTSFGVQGFVTLSGTNTVGDIRGLLAQPDDKIVVLGALQVVRITQNGMLDTSFNGTGYLSLATLLSVPPSNLSNRIGLLGATIQADGKLLLVIHYNSEEGVTWLYGRSTQVVARLNLDGTLDHDFADSGLYTVFDQEWTKIPQNPGFYGDPGLCGSILVQASGKIVIPNTLTFQFVRLNANGLVDPTFIADDTPQFDKVHPFDCWLLYNGVADSIMAIGSGPVRRWRVNGAWVDKILGNTYEGIVGVQPDGSLIVSDLKLGTTGTDLRRNVKTQTLPEPSEPTSPPPPHPLVLIYAVLDNNLGDEWFDLINKIEVGVRDDVDVRLLLDGPTVNDAYVYQVPEDHNAFCPDAGNPTCNGRYADGQNRRQFPTEDTARPASLYQFVARGLNDYPQATQVILVLVGHGSGWGANVLPAQPSYWKKQNDTLGGMLWDDHTGGRSGTRSLSTLGLGDALRSVQAETGRGIDLLYLDGCSMGMTEVAYELAGTARYLLASPNTDWATFSHDHLLPEVKAGVDARTLGQRWLAREAEVLRHQPGHPFTLALTDLQQMGQFSTTVSVLGDALQASLPTQRTQIEQAFAASDRYDSNYDAKLDLTDNYIDLKAFARQLQQVGLTDSIVISAAQQVESVLASAVISTAFASGTPWIKEDQTWAWQTMGGLSIYAPLGQDEAKRRIYYNSNNLTWAADTTWDEFLSAFWTNAVNAAAGEMPVCQATTDGCTGLAQPHPTEQPDYQLIYLSVIKR